MRRWASWAAVLLLAVGAVACSAATRYRTLSIFFDGVPKPEAARPTSATGGSAVVATPGRSAGSTHGPFAARLCSACHESAYSSGLVTSRDQICFRCHDLELTKPYIHGPLASGGCLACHDPHTSRYDYLLISESSGFCLHCHDASSIARVSAHEGAGEQQCTSCHDAHMSDRRFLLR